MGARPVVAPPGGPLAAALAAVEAASTSPATARRLADQVRGDRRAGAEARSVADRGLGLASMALGDHVAAVHHLRRAVRGAEHGGLPDRAIEARTSLVFALTGTGRLTAALAEANQAAKLARGPAAAAVQAQRATVLTRLGRYDEALAGYDRAVTSFVRAGDAFAEARVRSNRGVLRAYRGNWEGASADLGRAEALHRAAGRQVAAAGVVHNRGFLLALRGDVPAALSCFDTAASQYRAHGADPGLLLVDRAELLLSVHLVGEALAVAAAAVADYSRRRMGANLAEARLALARAATLAGDHEVARTSAAQARRDFRRQGREG
ncbi:MAG: CHAT domain-containing protein, partial [Acidimicrobiales bacterium]